jgi:hypothetical protein
MPAKIGDLWYDADHQVSRVRHTGEIRWKGYFVFIGEALAGEFIGLTELDNGDHVVRFCRRDLGVLGHTGAFRRFAAMQSSPFSASIEAVGRSSLAITRSKPPFAP